MAENKTEYFKLAAIRKRANQLGVLFLVIAAVVCVNESLFVAGAATVKARVSWINLDEMRTPVLEFTTRNGEFKSMLAQENNLFYDYREGMQLDVLYDPAHPEQVKFTHFLVLWAGAVFFGLLALACFVFAYLMSKFMRLCVPAIVP